MVSVVWAIDWTKIAPTIMVARIAIDITASVRDFMV